MLFPRRKLIRSTPFFLLIDKVAFSAYKYAHTYTSFHYSIIILMQRKWEKNLMIDMFSRLDRCLAKASTHLLYRRRRERRESSFYLSIFLSVNIQFVGVMSEFCLYNSIGDMTIGERNKTRTKISRTIATSGSLYIKVKKKILAFGVNEIDWHITCREWNWRWCANRLLVMFIFHRICYVWVELTSNVNVPW